MKTRKNYIFLILLLTLVIQIPVPAVSPDLTNMGHMLNFNKSAIKFIDICISNLAGAEDKKKIFPGEMKEEYKKAIGYDFYAQLWYLQRNYSRSYIQSRKSQKILQTIYRKILLNYIDETWALLEEAAPMIVRTQDKSARHLLKLSYRDLESSKLFFQRGFNIKPTLHTNQIQQYRSGIKRIRRSRRYAILSLIEAKLPHSEKPQFQVITLDDVKNKKAGLEIKQSDYIRVRNYLINLMGRNLLPRSLEKRMPREASIIKEPKIIKLKLLEIHQDNYGRLLSTRISIWQILVSGLETKSFHAKKALPKRNSQNRFKIKRENSGPDKPEKDNTDKKKPDKVTPDKKNPDKKSP